MRILRRYILTLFCRTFLLGTAAFVGLYLLVDFFEKVDTFLDHQAQLSQYLLYFSWKVPLIVVQILPLAVLLAVFLTLGGLSRTSELTAMRASGIGLGQAAVPLLGLSLLVSLGALIAAETLIPFSARQTTILLDQEVKGKAPLEMKLDRLWFREGNAIVNVTLAMPKESRLQGITIFGLDEEFRLLSRTDAAQATHSGSGWVLADGIRREFDPVSGEIVRLQPFTESPLPLTKAPEDFRRAASENEEMGFRELHRLTKRLQAEGFDATRLRVDLHARLATPFASFIMAFLGTPFALQRGRAAGLAQGVALTIAIGIAYQMVHAALLAFGYSSVLPAALAAWSANLLFGLFGVWLLLSIRQ